MQRFIQKANQKFIDVKGHNDNKYFLHSEKRRIYGDSPYY